MSNTNPFPQGSAIAAVIDRVLSMTEEDAAAFLRFLEEQQAELLSPMNQLKKEAQE